MMLLCSCLETHDLFCKYNFQSCKHLLDFIFFNEKFTSKQTCVDKVFNRGLLEMGDISNKVMSTGL